MTRQQRYLSQARQNVETMRNAPPKVRRVYGGLCHKLPILVRTNGLCQTVALVEAKSSGTSEQARAYQALREHVGDLLGLSGDGVVAAVRDAELTRYVRYTRALLEGWTYYKRFAVSILEVESASAVEAAS